MTTPPVGKHTCPVKVTSGEVLADSHEPGLPPSPQHILAPSLPLGSLWSLGPSLSLPPS